MNVSDRLDSYVLYTNLVLIFILEVIVVVIERNNWKCQFEEVISNLDVMFSQCIPPIPIW